MSKSAVAFTLALIAATLGAGAAYLRQQVRAQPERAAQLAPPAFAGHTQPAAPVPLAAPARAAASATSRPQPLEAPPERAVLPTDQDHQGRQRRQAADYLLRHGDPAGRAALRELALDSARRSTADLARRLDLTPGQYDRLVQLIADQDLDQRLATARCAADPACVSPAPDSAVFSARDQEIRDIIGDDGLRELRADLHAGGRERRIVDGLQARLAGGAALTVTQAADLTRALFDENRRQQRELYQRQQHGQAFRLADGTSLTYADDAPSPELALRSGEMSVQATRDRAATVLTGEQLAAFNRMHDDLLVAFRAFIRDEYAPRAPDADHTP